MLLIDDILLLPFKGLMGVFKTIHDMAEKEVNDEKYTLGKLMELQLRYEMGEISKEEYEKEEEKFQTKLNDIREADN